MAKSSESQHNALIQSVVNMDVLLRCPICKNYLKNPVLISGCSHNFCSDCIRRSLLHKNECPVCRNSSLRSHLISNKIMNQLLHVYELQNKKKTDAVNITKKCKSIQCNLLPSNTDIFSTNSRNTNCENMSNTNHNKRNKKRKASEMDSEAGNILNEPPKNRRKLTHNLKTVNCPICNKAIVKSFINSHIDKCLNKPEVKCNKPEVKCFNNNCNKPEVKCTINESDNDEDIDIKKVENEQEVRTKDNCAIKTMPFLAYSHMKEKELRKILDTLHLKKKGDKKLLIKRHREFVLRHNTQIDAYLNGNQVISDRAIAREINKEESKEIHSKFFAPSNNQKRNNLKRKNQREQLYKKLIKDLKQRMGKKWCAKRRKFRKNRRKMRQQMSENELK